MTTTARAAPRALPKPAAPPEAAGSLRRDARLAGEEALGAELLVSRELLAHVGIFHDTIEQLGHIGARQARKLTSDYAATASDLISGRVLTNPAGVLGAHLTRRLAHWSEGVVDAVTVLRIGSERAGRALFDLWLPFNQVVRRDWTEAQPNRHLREGT